MINGHPKGLLVLSLANMGERFGYYTMLAIFTLYLQAKYGWDSASTTQWFGAFLAAVYFLPLLGGIVADKFLGYSKTITIGIFVMLAGYFLMAFGPGIGSLLSALFIIALGTGLFKGNLQVIVGNLYDAPEYQKNRDLGFSIFYMCINVGAFFAPSAAETVSNYFLGKEGLTYNQDLPQLAHQLITNNSLSPDSEGFKSLLAMLNEQFNGIVNTTNIADYAHRYIDVLSNSYSWSFAVACVSLVVSLIVFFAFRNTYMHVTKTETEKAKDKNLASEVVELTPQETKKRLTALGLVFFVVIFFWMSFHQNGSTMTFFARDYTLKAVGQFDSLWFTLKAMVPAMIAFYGFYFAFTAKTSAKKMAGVIVGAAFTAIIWLVYSGQPDLTKITPQIFQQFNPFYIIILTPIFIAFFSWLNKRDKEPSAPRKIGFGMLIAGLGFLFLMFGSFGLPAPATLHSAPIAEGLRVTPYWLMGTYLILTCAELFLSPMGISFVSKVAPPKYKGLMQGGWFAATAIGNYLVGVLGGFWEKVDLPIFWGILIVCTILSAIFIFSQMKKLESATN